MGNIVLLDDLTINKIAAGEVIERPASVIKEMMENSIDAGATNIVVEIKSGGISFIRISDNGKGISRDDVELAFERHATSKIRSADDLDTVKSMGFRGEALASIAAIAKVELLSKTENDEIGTKIVVEGGSILQLEDEVCSKGTTITVKNLFFNTPVRYKFLKKDFTESGYIEDVITRIALIHPEIAIKFVDSGKKVIQTNGNGELSQVIYNIFGKEVANNIINVEYEYEYIKIKGVIGNPSIARSNRTNQIFFVNKRYIKDKTLSSAVEQAFKGMLPIGKFAFLVLNLEMTPSKVDVNVHPAKLEVRFAEENIVFKAMFHGIKDTLLNVGFMSEREKTMEINQVAKEAFKIKDLQELANNTYSINKNTTGNIVEDIYNNKMQEYKSNENINVIDNPVIKSNQEVFEKLKLLQEDLKREVISNPNLQLTDKYKEMEQQYNDLVSPLIEENDKIEIIEETKETFKEKIVPMKFESEKDEINLDAEEEKEEVEVTKNDNVLQVEPLNENILKKSEESEDEINEDNPVSFEEMYKKLFGKEPYGGINQVPEEKNNYYTIDTKLEDSNVTLFEGKGEYNPIQYKFIGIAFKTYIILEIENEIYIMDQHAAHERVMYEKVKKNFFSEEEKSSQLLLLPDIITLTHKEMDIAKDNLALFKKAGFIVEEFGENTIKLSGVPEVCIDLNTEELFKETLDEINTVARTAKQEKEERFIATVACKAAVKANMSLTKEEVDSLMNELLKLPNPFTCPHGRPTVIKMSKYEIERKFARK